jgi:ABC-type glycerol-3-phosphate transport system permease component
MRRPGRLALGRTLRRTVSYLMLITFAVLILIPVVWFLVTSLKTNLEYMSYPIRLLPAKPQWDNYVKVFTTGGFSFARYAQHSLYLAVVFTLLNTTTSSLAGFAFARFRVPGSSQLFTLVIAMLIIPGIVTTIPQFVVFSRLHLTNSYWPWILWGLTASPFQIFMFRQFFLSFPKELEDAAEVDGCTPFRLFWQIFIPNAQPVFATSLIFNFNWVWGDYFLPLIYLSDAKTTLAVKLATAYVDPRGNALYTITIAASVIYTLPLILIFFLGQKYILKGVVTSGIKG